VFGSQVARQIAGVVCHAVIVASLEVDAEVREELVLTSSAVVVNHASQNQPWPRDRRSSREILALPSGRLVFVGRASLRQLSSDVVGRRRRRRRVTSATVARL